MCLAIPGRIIEKQALAGESDARMAMVEFGTIRRPVYLDLLPEAEVGDYVLVHTGFAISVVDEYEARHNFAVLEKQGLLEEEGLAAKAEGA